MEMEPGIHLEVMKLLIILALTAVITQGLPATGFSQSWTQDLEAPSLMPQPEWVKPLVSEVEPVSLGRVAYEILPVPHTSGLLVTFVFDEVEEGFLRVFWKSGESTKTLSGNLYEGITLPNQRSLLISQELLSNGGIMTVQASGKNLGIHQIRWEWLNHVPVLSPLVQEIGLLDRLGIPLRKSDVNGEFPTVPEDLWENRIVTAQITEKPQRIEQGVEFSVELDATPSMARLESKFNGLDSGKGLVLWVNGKKAGLFYPESPDLRDLGYWIKPDGNLGYRGWRKMSVDISRGLLQAGLNTIQFSFEESGKTEEPVPPSVALKELKLQLNFSLENTKPQPEKAPESPEVELVPEGAIDQQ